MDFKGFEKDMPAFFAALSFNNNREYFTQHKAEFNRLIKEPLYALAEVLAPAVHRLDETLDTRPERVVSRIYRDMRYAHDRLPYRDYMWIGYRTPGEDRMMTCGFYFDISADSSNWGCGFYHTQPQYMQAFRKILTENPRRVLSILDNPAFQAGRFRILGDSYKRKMEPPADMDERLQTLYRMKSFYIQHTVDDFELLLKKELADEIIRGFEALAPFYYLMRECMIPSYNE